MAMLEDVGIDKALPGFSGDIHSAVDLYRSFRTTRGSYAELEAVHGAVAIDIEPLKFKAAGDEADLWGDDDPEAIADGDD